MGPVGTSGTCRQVRAASDADATDGVGNASDGNCTICDDDGNDAVAIDCVAAAGGDVTVIPTGDPKPPDRRVYLTQWAFATGKNTRDDEGVPQSDDCCGSS